jgi:hypothetical protein
LRKRKEVPMNNEGKISIDTAKVILEEVETLKSLVIGFMGALHEEMDNSNEEDPDEPKTIQAAGWFVVDKKILLSTFGYTISERFRVITHYIEKLEKIHD